jgi:hypothetical protein
MELKELFNIKSKLAMRMVGDELVLVPLTSNVSDMDELFTLNELGCFIWDRITETSTENEIVLSVIKEYDVDENIAKRDVADFLSRLQQLMLK